MQIERVYEVFPDFELWSNTYAHVIQEQDPLRDMIEDDDKDFLRRNSLLMPMLLNEKQGSLEYNAYLIPEDESLTSYKWKREYFSKKINYDEIENAYYLRFSDNNVYYKPIKMRLELSDAATLEQKEQLSRITKPSRILIEKREPNPLEQEDAKTTMENLYEPWLDVTSKGKNEFSDEDFEN